MVRLKIGNLKSKIQNQLLAWFRANARDLPWRHARTPYRVWLSEMMLQQTQVETVIPYFHRFLNRFPTIGDLAAAPLGDVLKLWEGLGYYARARNLHKAAQVIVDDRHGEWPRTVEGLLTLPGIGRYTAGAIASNAFDERAPIVDGNIERVLCRVFRVSGNPKSTAVRKTLWSIAEQLVPEKDPGLFNQAIMEVGSEVCTPRNPKRRLPAERGVRSERNGQSSLPTHIEEAAATPWRSA
jgi:A/G-specific adenine glycosylase